MSANKYFVTLPALGAARMVGEEFVPELIRQLGSENVMVFDCRDYQTAFRQLLKDPVDSMVNSLLNQSMIVKSYEFGTTHLLVLALSPISIFNLNLHKARGVKNLHWFYEDYRELDEHWKTILPGYHLFMAVQHGEVEQECKALGITYKYLTTACTPQPPPALDAEGPQEFDVAFVGIPSPYRIEILESLVAANLKVAIAGSGWQEYQGTLQDSILSCEWVSPDQARQILAGAKIGLNISQVDPAADREHTQISPRAFDVLDSNCILVTEDVPLLKETLAEMEYLTFNSPAEIVRIITNALQHFDTHRQSFARNREIIQRDNTYEKRATEIIRLGNLL